MSNFQTYPLFGYCSRQNIGRPSFIVPLFYFPSQLSSAYFHFSVFHTPTSPSPPSQRNLLAPLRSLAHPTLHLTSPARRFSNPAARLPGARHRLLFPCFSSGAPMYMYVRHAPVRPAARRSSRLVLRTNGELVRDEARPWPGEPARRLGLVSGSRSFAGRA